MNRKLFPVIAVLLVFAVFSLVGCWGSDDDDDLMNIVETAVENGNFTTLVAALEAAELDDDLAGEGPFTVFAPTDDAFDALPEGVVDDLLLPANQAVLIDLLLYHVYDGSVLAADALALDGTAVEMLNGDNLRFDVVGSDLILNLNGNREATVTITDILCSNGVIHVIDVVLDPEDAPLDIIQTASASSDFDTLVAAIVAAGLDDDLAGPGPFTVFAPIDAAFDAIGASTLSAILDSQTALVDILTYHVYDGSVLAADALALDGTAVEMLNGDNLRFDVVGSDLILNLNGNREATVTITDILCSNGVIHVIDVVLDPEDAPLDIIQTASASSDFDTLVAAIVAAGLDDDLAGPGPFTVFAPIDAAFNAIGASTLDAILADQDTLVDILLYHVFDGSVLAAAALSLDGSSVTMLNGDDLSFDIVMSDLVLNEGGTSPATVILTDILCSNGVIHVIDTVLDPGDAPTP